MKFTDRNGEIILDIRRERRNELLLEKDYLLISVNDNGVGIKKKNKGKLFRLFGSIKNQKKKVNIQGIGLGLVISKMIVERFGGYIDFISRYKHGSSFFFTFQVEDFDIFQLQEI